MYPILAPPHLLTNTRPRRAPRHKPGELRAAPPSAPPTTARRAPRYPIGYRAARRTARVSGGQAQRAAIARALSIEPTVLLADEPTDALDPATSESVLATLLEQTLSRGTCLIMVTHDEEVSRTTHRRLELREGRLHKKAS
ncbi:ATP-binding cassette domain-containing protein [Corynebacterium mastitidis]|uniref:ATP-binding cassette domain-containing protein n=1 Tax=Corynebacterium mastitidis TaxID=161890 RepID=A0ABU8NZP7_9CORY